MQGATGRSRGAEQQPLRAGEAGKDGQTGQPGRVKRAVSRRRFIGFGLGVVSGAMVAPVLARQERQSLTIVVGGLDTRTPEEPENTDVLLVARVDLDRPGVRALSIPRDLLVEIPGVGYDKVNRAYDYGSKAAGGDWEAGAALTVETVAANFGLDVDGIVLTNFDGFADVIDAFGGIDLVNPYEVYDGEYPTPDYGYKEIYFPAGEIHLDGEDALAFARTRHQDGDDGRVMRQQLVLLALLAKAQDPANLSRLPRIVREGRKAVRTDLGSESRAALIELVPVLSADDVVFGTITQELWGDTTESGMWVYRGDWSTLPGYVQGFLAGV
jgi:polyisoprenyl-teichoic acid--peptidoglycan teichoic acid transferase